LGQYLVIDWLTGTLQFNDQVFPLLGSWQDNSPREHQVYNSSGAIIAQDSLHVRII
jgi:hypothetical protein